MGIAPATTKGLLISLLASGVLALTGCSWGDPSTGPSPAGPRRTSALPTSPSPTAIAERPPPACARHSALPLDFDGNGITDWAYHDFVRRDGVRRAEFGWCIGDRHGSFRGMGMAETLYALDLHGDGHHEAFFGANSCCTTWERVAVYAGDRVRVVRLDGEPLELMGGNDPEMDPNIWFVHGCDSEKRDAVTQVAARLEGDQLVVVRTWYEFDGATATIIGRGSYTIPDPGPRFRGRDVSETVGGCIPVIDPDY